MGDEREYVMCIVATPADDAPKIARAILEARLAACIQVVPGVTSLYWWDGKIDEAREVLLFIKTKSSLTDDIQALLATIHPYDVPEFIILPLIGGLPAYFDWLDDVTKS